MAGIIAWLAGSKLGRIAGMVGLAVAAMITAWLMGRSSQRARDARRRLENYRDTRRRMDDADAELGNDPDIARRWLRDRAQRDRDL
ncbi:MAG: hypothetical protein D6773_04420 [Alphaproteobacteria bacterium]|nr:MAG: hypothetical protein D6773_04420 [Alphaproteobacteria bacterium]